MKTYTYFQITGIIDGQTVNLFGSYEKSDCTSEKEIERSQWKSEGYKSIKIITKQVDQAPDSKVYDLDANNIIVNGHRYTFVNNILINSNNDDVARYKPATDINEYAYFINIESNEVMHSVYMDRPEFPDTIARQLAAIYENY